MPKVLDSAIFDPTKENSKEHSEKSVKNDQNPEKAPAPNPEKIQENAPNSGQKTTIKLGNLHKNYSKEDLKYKIKHFNQIPKKINFGQVA